MSSFKGSKQRGTVCFQPPLKRAGARHLPELSLQELCRKESASWLRVTKLLCMGFHFTFFYEAVVRKRGSDGKCKYLQDIQASAGNLLSSAVPEHREKGAEWL